VDVNTEPVHEEASMDLTVRTVRDVICGSAMAVALCAAPAFAQQQPAPAPATPPPPAQQQPTVAPLPPEPEGFTLTPFLGAGFSGDLESSPAAFGLGVGYGYTDRVSLEAELGITPNGSMGIPVTFDTSVWTLSGNVLYHFITQENFTPYVTAGIGVLGSSPDLPTDLFPDVNERTNSFAWNVGAGVKTAISDRFGLRGDLRHFNGSGLAPDHWRLYGGIVVRRIGQW
jgi:opacity protein-like surface antigen